MSRAEVILWQRLRRNQLGVRFRRQVPIGTYVADFACIEARLVIEVDGDTHSRRDEIAHDRMRTAYMTGEGWYVHRIWNVDVYDNLEGVLDAVDLLLRDSLTPPKLNMEPRLENPPHQ